MGETGTIYLNPDAMAAYGLSRSDLAEVVQVQQREIARRQDLYRQGRQMPRLTDRIVILVDDGIATGSTFFASAESIKQLKPRRLIGAIPVGPMETIQEARNRVDELVVLATPEPFWAVGNHYIDFAQVSDHDAVTYLNLAEESLLAWKERPHSSTVSPPQ